MSILSFVAMYALMYMMVDRYANVYANINQWYMAAVMTGAMIVIEVLVMRAMYTVRARIIASVIGALILVGFFMAMRYQTAVGDREFLRSMIPHHGAALLMCEQAQLNDPEIIALCDQIVESQQGEIDWMKSKLNDLK